MLSTFSELSVKCVWIGEIISCYLLRARCHLSKCTNDVADPTQLIGEFYQQGLAKNLNFIEFLKAESLKWIRGIWGDLDQGRFAFFFPPD